MALQKSPISCAMAGHEMFSSLEANLGFRDITPF